MSQIFLNRAACVPWNHRSGRTSRIAACMRHVQLRAAVLSFCAPRDFSQRKNSSESGRGLMQLRKKWRRAATIPVASALAPIRVLPDFARTLTQSRKS